MLELKPGHPKLDAGLIEVDDHLQFLRRRHASKSFDLNGVKWLNHDGNYPTVVPAMARRLNIL